MLLTNLSPIEILLEQGTPEWLTWRESHLGGSDIAVVAMGDKHPFSNPTALWKLKTKKAKPVEFNERMARGHALEPVARELYQQRTGIRIRPTCYEHPYLRFAGVSLDGDSKEANLIVEIKAPNKKTHQMALDGELPEYYYWQIQYQLAVTGRAMAHYVSYNPDDFPESENFALVPTPPNPAAQLDMLKKAEVFWKHVEQDVAPTSPYSYTFTRPELGKFGIKLVAGYARAGKDTLSNSLTNQFGSTRFGFADKLKEVLIKMGLWDGKEETKEAVRPLMIALGEEMREVYPDVWLQGVYGREDFIEVARTTGAVVSDCRKVNEWVQGQNLARKLGVPFQLLWVDGLYKSKPIGPVHESEALETSLLRPWANVRLANDLPLKTKADKVAFDLAAAFCLIEDEKFRGVRSYRQ